MSAASYRRWGVALAIVGTLVFSFRPILVKLVYVTYPVSPVTLLFLRMTISLPFFLAVAWWLRRDEPRLTARDWAAVAVLTSREIRTTGRPANSPRTSSQRRETMSDKRKPRAGIDRRSFIGSSVAAAGLYASGVLRRAWAQDIRLAKATRSVQTASGNIQGVVLDGGVNAFYGVPYGASLPHTICPAGSIN